MSCLGDLAIGVLSRAGPVNLAAALRHPARDPDPALATSASTSTSSSMQPTLRNNGDAWPPGDRRLPGARCREVARRVRW
jgi:hypothetical protein